MFWVYIFPLLATLSPHSGQFRLIPLEVPFTAFPTEIDESLVHVDSDTICRGLLSILQCTID